MKVYRTLNAVEVFDEGILNDFLEEVEDECEFAVIDGRNDGAEVDVYCVGESVLKKYHLDLEYDTSDLVGEYRITRRSDDLIETGPVRIEKVSKFSNVWRVGGSYFGDVSAEENLSEYGKDY